MKLSNIPCTMNFSEVNHTNLLKVKIVVMHEGENRNGSAFSMQAIESARDTLKNVPILGYILRADDGEALDFDEHNMSVNLVRGNDGYELKEFYEEQIIGIIPETNDYHYEMIDGVNHVCCTGYIFKSYSNGGADIVANCESKGVSMEISVGGGSFVNDIYHIKDYQYQAVTVLGDHVPQGMNGTCNIKKFSLNDSTKQTIKSICEEVQKINQGKEDIFMDTNVEKVEFEESRKVDDAVEVEPLTPLEPSTPVEPPTEPDPEPEPPIEGGEEAVEEVVDSVEEASDAEADGEDFACAPKKKKKYEDEEDDEEKKKEDEEKDKFSLDCFSIFFGEEVPSTLIEVCDALVNKFNEINSELEELKEFKSTIEKESLKAEVDETCAEFNFDEEEVSEIKEKAYNAEITVDQFKKELFALEGMKAHANKTKFAQKEKTIKTKIAVVGTHSESREPYGGLFAKYMNK